MTKLPDVKSRGRDGGVAGCAKTHGSRGSWVCCCETESTDAEGPIAHIRYCATAICLGVDAGNLLR
jgi:hypothetical protein